jgi:hypothetical protein
VREKRLQKNVAKEISVIGGLSNCKKEYISGNQRDLKIKLKIDVAIVVPAPDRRQKTNA